MTPSTTKQLLTTVPAKSHTTHQRFTHTRRLSRSLARQPAAAYHTLTMSSTMQLTQAAQQRTHRLLSQLGVRMTTTQQQLRQQSTSAENNKSATKEHSLPFDEKYEPPERVRKVSHLKSFDEYKKMWKHSIEHNDEFWGQQAKENLAWFQPFDRVKQGTWSENGHVAWFLNGKLNASYNMVDRHIIAGNGNKVAIIAEGDEPDDVRHITYNQLLDDVCKFANALKVAGVKKGDGVCVYMPNIADTIVALLAIVRLGAFHNVIFAGFSSDAIAERIMDSNNKFVIVADESVRGGKKFPLKKTLDTALGKIPEDQVKKVFVFKRTGAKVQMKEGRDVYWHDAVKSERPYCPPVAMDSEDPLFTLYTSGSTGKPKGLLHTTAGYLLYTQLTTKYIFDLQPEDRYACLADIAWITGHSYIMYGPLLNGATTYVFESTPIYPNPERYWDSIERHKLNIIYSSPTAIRTLMKYGHEIVKKHDLSSIRVLGTVGEPINPEAWRWFHEVVGNKQCSIVDTYWQTETGGHMITPFPGATAQKPGSASFPFFGIDLGLMNPEGKEVKGNDVAGNLIVKTPWPGMARTIWGDHSRYIDAYLKMHPGTYTTGDGALRDQDGYYWITGRTDDVVNVSGHRIGSAEIEGAIVSNHSVAECATVGIAHPVKGSSLFCYVILKNKAKQSEQLINDLKAAVKDQVGSFAKPDDVVIVPGLPKTRSGKIMRRMLRKIAEGETDVSKLGDTSTLERPEVVEEIVEAAKSQRATKPDEVGKNAEKKK